MPDIRVLHIEDEVNFQLTCKSAFVAIGCDYRALTTAEEAREELKNEKVDLLVVDCFLRSAGINGDKFIEEILSEGFWKGHIVFVSTSPRPTMIKTLKVRFPDAPITEAPKDHFIDLLKEFQSTKGNASSSNELFQFLDQKFVTANA
jgi:DNA-binding NtrC family response regulator